MPCYALAALPTRIGGTSLRGLDGRRRYNLLAYSRPAITAAHRLSSISAVRDDNLIGYQARLSLAARQARDRYPNNLAG